MQQTIINYFSIDEREYYAQLKKTNKSSRKKTNRSNKEKTIINNIKTY